MSTVLILADFVGAKATKTNAELATAGARIGEVTAVVLAPVGGVWADRLPRRTILIAADALYAVRSAVIVIKTITISS